MRIISRDHLGTLFDYIIYILERIVINYHLIIKYSKDIKKKILRVSIKKTELNANSLNTLTYRLIAIQHLKKAYPKAVAGRK